MPGPTVNTAIAVKVDDAARARARAALAAGNKMMFLVHWLGSDETGASVIAKIRDADPEQYARLVGVAEELAALRSENVVALVDGEAFAMRTRSGRIRRVTTRVPLSMAAGQLYQMTYRKNFGGDDWRSVPRTPGFANLTVDGYRALNRFAGLSVGLPPEILVDGVRRTNPYVEREAGTDGSLGSVRRIVVCAAAAGLSGVGAPVVVRYVLEYEPANELRHALMKRASTFDKNDRPKFDDVIILPADDVPAFKAEAKNGTRWRTFRLYEGMVIAANLASPGIIGIIGDMMQVVSQAIGKAQTVAMRGAMKAHPSLAVGIVPINQETGIGYVTVTGWTGDEDSIDRYRDTLDRLVHDAGTANDAEILVAAPDSGTTTPAQVLNVEHSFDPSEDNVAAEDEREVVFSHEEDERDGGEVQAGDSERDKLLLRNALIAQADDLFNRAPSRLANRLRESLGYDPNKNSADELRDIVGKLQAREAGAAEGGGAK